MKLSEQLQKVFITDKKDFTSVIGQNEVKRQLKSALLAGRHILIVGPPGIGKTTIAKNVAKMLPEIEVNDCPYHCSPNEPICPECKNGQVKGTKKISGTERFVRVQGSPDLTAEDLIGDIDPGKAMEHGPLSMEAFTPGKIFKANNGLFFFDELNRAPEKLQNALLQALQEQTVTIGSYDLDLEVNFIFIATMNPEDTNTEAVSEVLLDRFDVAYMEYPEDQPKEEKIVVENSKKFIEVPSDIRTALVQYVRFLRESDQLERFPSVRASIGLYERAQTLAMIRGREEVKWKDVEDVMISVMSHRIKLKPSAQYLQTPQKHLKEKLEEFCEQEGIERDTKEGDSP